VRFRKMALACTLAAALGFVVLPARTTLAAPAMPAPALSIAASVTTSAYSSRVWLTVTLGTTQENRMVSIYAKPVGMPEWLWHSGAVNSAGRLRVYFRLMRTTTFTAVFSGDPDDAPAQASRTVDALARVADRVSGYNAKTRVGGIPYYVFRHGSLLVLHATVSPNKRGECLKPETEQWNTGSGWADDTRYGCDYLDSGSHDSAPFNLARAVGDRYRMRADYVRGARDLANLSADGPWLYLMVVR